MGIDTMGKVVVAARIENLGDVYEVGRERRGRDQVRTVYVNDALVDPDSSILLMPSRLIQQLGLYFRQSRNARTGEGNGEVRVYNAVRLTIHGRDCITDVIELPEDRPVTIGRVLLHMLDFVIDPDGQRLIGNPEHGGEPMLELY
jgi:predicted aspartyl protease